MTRLLFVFLFVLFGCASQDKGGDADYRESYSEEDFDSFVVETEEHDEGFNEYISEVSDDTPYPEPVDPNDIEPAINPPQEEYVEPETTYTETEPVVEPVTEMPAEPVDTYNNVPAVNDGWMARLKRDCHIRSAPDRYASSLHVQKNIGMKIWVKPETDKWNRVYMKDGSPGYMWIGCFGPY